jgi:hypothetical protein
MNNNRLRKGVVLAPIAIGAVCGLIQGGAWVVQHAIVNPLFEAKDEET